MVRDDGVQVTPPISVISVEEAGGAQWVDCVVGYFLDKTLPFPVVKSITSRIWRKFGLYEVSSNS